MKKACNGCGETRPLDDFHKHPNSAMSNWKLGLRPCVAQRGIRVRAYRDDGIFARKVVLSMFILPESLRIHPRGQRQGDVGGG
ncbi:hypothetical protein LCGC14_1090020 [marine sediment metagenome]|uniref:Uncharacterized protein n=1 Tax=marine sediment metagenome TaxID=412755 RepID=A0A0F9PVS6_9ZZZZ